MRSRMLGPMSGTSMMGLGLGLLAGAAAGVLLAPMRGSLMRASLRSRADDAVTRGMQLLEDGKRAFRTRRTSAASPPLSATLGEIAETHAGREAFRYEARS